MGAHPPTQAPSAASASLGAGPRQLRLAIRGHAAILRKHGAAIGTGCTFRSPVLIAAGEPGFRNLEVSAGASFGPGIVLDLSGPLRIGARASIGPRCTLGASDRGANGETCIGEGVVLEPGVIVRRGVSVGAGAWIGGHAVVAADVPPGARIESPALRDLNARG